MKICYDCGEETILNIFTETDHMGESELRVCDDCLIERNEEKYARENFIKV